MDRRGFLKLLAMGVVGHELDIDRLLWLPGQKKIFLPPRGITESQIVALELERILPKIKTLFERDDVFYQTFKRNGGTRISSRTIRVPLEIKPGEK